MGLETGRRIELVAKGMGVSVEEFLAYRYVPGRKLLFYINTLDKGTVCEIENLARTVLVFLGDDSDSDEARLATFFIERKVIGENKYRG